jgi:hypothetical protein
MAFIWSQLDDIQWSLQARVHRAILLDRHIREYIGCTQTNLEYRYGVLKSLAHK